MSRVNTPTCAFSAAPTKCTAEASYRLGLGSLFVLQSGSSLGSLRNRSLFLMTFWVSLYVSRYVVPRPETLANVEITRRVHYSEAGSAVWPRFSLLYKQCWLVLNSRTSCHLLVTYEPRPILSELQEDYLDDMEYSNLSHCLRYCECPLACLIFRPVHDWIFLVRIGSIRVGSRDSQRLRLPELVLC
jgi:hypothetical protein